MSTPQASLLRRLLPLASAAILAIASAPSQAQQLIAPNAPIAGLSQSFLAAQMAQWVLSYPAATNPLLDTTGARAAAGDQGSYFFLNGSFDATPVVRNVTVRTDQTLVINLVSLIDWMGLGLVTEAAIREEAANVMGVNPALSLTVDGAPALLPAGFTALTQFHQLSPLFPLTFIQGNVFGWPASVVPAVVDSYMVGLEALPQGTHQLHFTATTQGIGPFVGSSFSQDITYNISAVPEASTWASLSLGLAVIGVAALRRRRGSDY